MAIMPSFDRHKREGTLVGRIVLAFGELEVTLATTVGLAAFSDIDLGMRAIYSVNSTSARIDLADVLTRPHFVKESLSSEYQTTLRGIKNCRTIRNQYAHCNWSDSPGKKGLYFTNLEDAAERETGYTYLWRYINTALLKKQLNYFDNTLKWQHYIHNELMRSRKFQLLPNWPMPPTIEPPNLYNPPEKHAPPWLNEAEKRRHIELALAAKQSAQPRKAKPKVKKPSRAKRRANALAKRKV